MSSDRAVPLALDELRPGRSSEAAARRSVSRTSQSDRDIAIRAQNVSKAYLIYNRPQDRLKQSIATKLQRLIGRPPRAYYREFWALRNVSFEVHRGETVGIIGRNGAGKSTLLQILSGTLHPNSGSVETIGRVAALLELGSGFNPEFSGRENVYLYAALLGLSRKEIDARFDDIAAFADIGDFIDQPIKTYSTGMVVRIAFAVIAHVDADILIIDEALAVGDAFFVQKCMRFLRRFMQTGTILFVSHDTPAVINLCQRAIWLHQGAIRAIGSPKEIADKYLADLYEAQQGPSAVGSKKENPPSRPPEPESDSPRYDQRLKYINHSKFRNDIELFRFDPHGAGFGKGGAAILDVQLQDAAYNPLSWCVGGENVTIRVLVHVRADMSQPIVGFFVRDRLGQPLFGDNTFLSYVENPFKVRAGERFEAIFKFQMPILPVGDYSLCVSIADGTQKENIQHHLIHDAVVFKSHTSSLCTGLVGIPMQSIGLRRCLE